MKTLLFSFTVLCAIVTASIAAPPDLTNGGVPNENPPVTFNMGPTGARGWVYHVKPDSSESRQILVTDVEVGSPAEGILDVDDVILGADGTGANPVNFSSDARKSLAYAIADAEANSPAKLKLLRWRSGSTKTVTLTLQTMGAYSSTAPYNCPKSSLILQQGLQYVYDNEDAGRYSFGALTMLANGNPTYEAKAQAAAIALIPDQATIAQMTADIKDTTGNAGWQRGFVLIFLSEYYLATGDAQVLPAIEAYAVNISKNTSLFGTVGHGYADRNDDGTANGSMTTGYGAINQTSLTCLLGLELAKECGLTNPEIDPAIDRATKFYAYYTGKGSIPYGEHEPYTTQYVNNGRCGSVALAFMFQEDRVEEGKFFSKMCTAGGTEREKGHTGSFFNYLWSPLGAAVGGEEAAAAHFSEINWMLDLNRCWNGRFQYDCLNTEGPNSGETYHEFRMSTAALLTYALPLRKLRITGKGHDSSRWLSSTDVTEAIFAQNYDPSSRSDSELIADLSSWSPTLRYAVGDELATHTIDASELSQITALANNTSAPSGARGGACYALGQIGDHSSSATLAALMTDSDDYVRYMAAEGMRHLPQEDRIANLDTVLTAAATTGQPLYPFVEGDPMQVAHGKFAQLLFYSGNANPPRGIIYNDGINGVDRGLLYPAITALAKTPVGKFRGAVGGTYGYLDYDDVNALAGTIVDSIIYCAPADNMFSGGIRENGVKALQRFGIAEGVPACIAYAVDESRGGRRTPLELLGTFGSGVYTVQPDPGAIQFLEPYLYDPGTAAAAQASIDAIEGAPNSTTLVSLKGISSATVDDTTVTLPNNSTVLRVTGTDIAQGDTIYTWRRVSGPSAVTFGPTNGTSAGTATTVTLGLLGTYQFEVTMSDSRGLTEDYATLEVLLEDGTGQTDQTPPTPDPMAWASVPAPVPAELGFFYEPFDYTAGSLLEKVSDWVKVSGGTTIQTAGLSYGTLPVTGANIGSGGDYTLNSVASNLAAGGLLADGQTVWMSALFSPIVGSNANLVVRLGTDYVNEWSQISGGTGDSLGFNLQNGNDLQARYHLDGVLYSPDVLSNIVVGTKVMVVIEMIWNANPALPDILNYYMPDTLLRLGSPIATIFADFDQANFDTFSFSSNGDSALLDEIRIGATYDDVTAENFVEITMTASTATDPSGAEYYFTCTAGGGRDSGWQESPVYTDTGLTLGKEYTYTVMARDFSPAQNTTPQSIAKSAAAGDTTPYDTDPPTPNPATFAVAPAADSDTAISMTATTGTDASGPVEYLFTETSGNLGGTSSTWQTSSLYTDSGLTTGLTYSYTVTMRDAHGNTGTASPAAGAASCYVEGDLNKDCKVNLLDISKLAMGWLTTYDMSDMEAILQNWLTNQ